MSDNLKLQEGAEVGHKALYLTVIQITIPTRVFSVFVISFIRVILLRLQLNMQGNTTAWVCMRHYCKCNSVVWNPGLTQYQIEYRELMLT
jgi:hypothetical protein